MTQRAIDGFFLYFVTSNTTFRERLFDTSDKAAFFGNLLRQLCKQYDFVFFGYCILPDHVHFLVYKNGRTTLSRLMNIVKGRFLRDMEPGRFWQPRFNFRIIDNERRLANTLQYIQYNFQKHGLVDRFGRPPSSRFWLSRPNRPVFCYTDSVKLYRFSSIKNQSQLQKAIKHTHFACFQLCKQALGRYLPVAGNVGVFCHYDDEYEYLTGLRKELTDASDNFNNKYFRLYKPIVIPAKGDIPETTYTYLYIRQPDPYRSHVGGIDFVLDAKEYAEMKQALLSGKKIKGARAFKRGDPDMVELFDPEVDVLGYITTTTIEEKVRGSNPA